MQLLGDSDSARRLSAARFWLLLLAGLLVYLGAAEARAACVELGSSSNVLCDTREEAYAFAESFPSPYPVGANAGTCNQYRGGAGSPPNKVVHDSPYNSYGAVLHCQNRDYTGPRIATVGWATECPAGRSWDEATKKCACPAGSVAQPDGSCKSCEDLNGEPGSPARAGKVVRGFRERCIGGCTLKMTDGWCTSVGGVGGGRMMCSGSYIYTGESCSVDPLPPIGPEDPDTPEPVEEPKQECEPLGDGQTVCMKPNGDHCYTASTGKQICWKPGQTGRQNTGDTAQVRVGGTSPPSSPPLAPDGAPMTPTGDPMTTQTSNTATGQTIITTVNNYVTPHGTNAGDSDDGEPDDGSGRPGGDDSGDTSASGGGDCSTPPIVSGDAALHMVATQAWATRCAVEAGNAAAVTGDVGDCSSPFSVEGTNANAEKLRALRVQICGTMGASDASDLEAAMGELDDAIAGADGDDDGVDPEDWDEAANPDNFRQIRDLGAEVAELDDSGFIGNRSCPIAPTVSVAGNPLPLTFNWICETLANVSGLLVALAWVVGARIVAGVK